MRLKKTIGVFALVSFPIFLTACGGGSGEDNLAPSDATISISPSSTKWQTADNPDPACSPIALDLPVEVTVKDSSGNPLNDTAIWLSLDLSAGTTTGAEVMDLYDGDTQVTSPYKTKTLAAGTKNMNVRMWVGCNLEYRGYLHVYSGAVYGAADFELVSN